MLLKQLPSRLISLASKDEVPKKCQIAKMQDALVQNLIQSQTDGLVPLLELKDNARVNHYTQHRYCGLISKWKNRDSEAHRDIAK